MEEAEEGEEVAETVSVSTETPAEATSEEPEFVVNFPEEKEQPEEKDDIPFEIKNPPKGEQLGLF
jgi:hypothetical protein